MSYILVARLAEFINPWKELGLRRTRMRGHRQPGYVDEANRDTRYHHERIRHFADRFAAGLKVTPIQVDCMTMPDWVYAEPVLLDGHHRLAGAILADAKWIPANFGGRVDLLDYLQGKTEMPPDD